MKDAKRAEVALKRELMQMRRIEQLEYQFKFAIAAWATVHSRDFRLNYIDAYDDGAHMLTREEMLLTPEEEEMASNLVMWSSTYLLAVQMNTALERISLHHFNKPMEELRAAKIIVNLVRNAFAHNPMEPTWDIPETLRDRIFEVPRVIRLDTHEIQGMTVNIRRFGASSFLRLAQWLRGSYDSSARSSQGA